MRALPQKLTLQALTNLTHKLLRPRLLHISVAGPSTNRTPVKAPPKSTVHPVDMEPSMSTKPETTVMPAEPSFDMVANHPRTTRFKEKLAGVNGNLLQLCVIYVSPPHPVDDSEPDSLVQTCIDTASTPAGFFHQWRLRRRSRSRCLR